MDMNHIGLSGKARELSCAGQWIIVQARERERRSPSAARGEFTSPSSRYKNPVAEGLQITDQSRRVALQTAPARREAQFDNRE